MMSSITKHPLECKCFSWKPVIAGALVAIGLGFILNLFSVAIGLTSFRVESDGAQTLVLGGLIGTAIGIIASMFAAGWLSGYLGSRYCIKGHIGALYGFLSWCVALVIAIFLASHAQDYVVLYGNFISGVTNTGANPASAANVANTAAGPRGDSVVISAYIIFALFFLSAFAASLGGHCGMRHVCKEECGN